MELNLKRIIQKLVIMLIVVSSIHLSYASTGVKARVLQELKATDGETEIIAQIFFNYQIQYIWSYPNIPSNIIFIYIRPIGLVGPSPRSDMLFSINESLGVQKDFSGIIDKIQYEGSIRDGGFIVIHLSDDFRFSVQQGEKFNSVAVIIYKNIPEGAIKTDNLDLIEGSN